MRSFLNGRLTISGLARSEGTRSRRNSSTGRGLPSLLETVAKSNWIPSLLECPTIPECSEEYVKEDDSSRLTSSEIVDYAAFSLLLPPPSFGVEELEAILIETPDHQEGPSVLSRHRSAEGRLETKYCHPTSSEEDGLNPSLLSSLNDGVRAQPTSQPEISEHRRQKSASDTPSTSADDVICELNARLRKVEKRYGPHDARVFAVLNQIGNTYFRQKKYDKALFVYTRVVQNRKDNCGTELADAYANIGTVHWSTGKLDLAVGFLEQSLRVHERNKAEFGKSSRRRLASASVRHQLGLVYTLQGSHDQALKYLSQAYKIRASILGDTHLDVARSVDAIGKVHLYRGEYQESLQMHEEAFSIKQHLAQDIPVQSNRSLCESLSNIAAVHRARNDLAAAIFTWRLYVDLQEQDYRCSNSQDSLLQVAESLYHLAELYVSNRQYSEARKTYQEADQLFDAMGVNDRPAKAYIPMDRFNGDGMCFFDCFDIGFHDAKDILFEGEI